MSQNFDFVVLVGLHPKINSFEQVHLLSKKFWLLIWNIQEPEICANDKIHLNLKLRTISAKCQKCLIFPVLLNPYITIYYIIIKLLAQKWRILHKYTFCL